MSIILGILEEGLIYAILALGVYITYSILDFPDLSVDSTFPLGAAVGALLCLWLGVRASWVAGLFLLAWVLWMNMDEKRQAAGART